VILILILFDQGRKKNTKNKIVGIFMCILLIATTIPVVVSLKNGAINSTIPSTSLMSKAANWTEMQKLLATDGAVNLYFGGSVSLDGDTALIGDCEDNDNGEISGSAYVFTRTGTTWTQQAKLLPSGGKTCDYFGYSVSLSGDTALIGASGNIWSLLDYPGFAYVFTRTGTTWTQQAKLFASDGASLDWFGYSVSLSGDTALIGTPKDDNNGGDSGSAYIFTRNGTTWTQQQKLLASDGEVWDFFGGSVSLSGDTALIGASYDNDNGDASGSAYVFTRTGTTWTQQAKLLASDGATQDYFGYAVSLDGDTAFIGAEGDDDNGVDSGSAYVFTRTGTTWTQQQKLAASDGAAGDIFGYSVSFDGDTALIGAVWDANKGPDAGSAYVFTRTDTTWTQQQKLTASDGAIGDEFGVSVSLSGDTALIGADGDDDNGENSGSVYVFTKGGLGIDIIGGLGINVVITNNNETVPITTINWEITVKGGFLGMISKTTKGTIDVIEPESSETVGTGQLFGLGLIVIIVKVIDVEKIVEGTQFIIFSRVK